jgi:DNA invertase Pin-like site-specific DNA recombinase
MPHKKRSTRVGREKRVGIYLRVSTSGQTVENQRQDLARVAEQRGWTIAGEYVDHGVSGSKGRERRPAFDRLAKDAGAGKLDMVAAWSIDRIGRNVGHLVEFIDDLRQQNVGLYLHQQQVDTSTASGRAFLQMAGVFAEFERSVIVERINAGLARARAQGKHLGRPSVSAKVEQRIRDLRIEGFGMLKIARQLRCGVSTVQRVLLQPERRA